MKIEFEKDYLRELYTTGKTTDKKHRFQPQVVNGYLKCVKYLTMVALMEDLYSINMDAEKRLTAIELQPFRPVHPGELLKDELEYRHLSQRMISQRLGLPYTAFNEILNGKRPVTSDFALIMEAALGVPAYLLVGLQADYNLQMAQKDDKLSKRLVEIRKISAVL